MKNNWKVKPVSLWSRYYCKNPRVVQTLMSNIALHISVGRIGSCSRKVIPIFNQSMSFASRSVRRDFNPKDTLYSRGYWRAFRPTYKWCNDN